jgi:hypothetical protein
MRILSKGETMGDASGEMANFNNTAQTQGGKKWSISRKHGLADTLDFGDTLSEVLFANVEKPGWDR